MVVGNVLTTKQKLNVMHGLATLHSNSWGEGTSCSLLDWETQGKPDICVTLIWFPVDECRFDFCGAIELLASIGNSLPFEYKDAWLSMHFISIHFESNLTYVRAAE